jgi:HD-GYP domain-containing protein (c-di-GMP phosphodiesterase class II)
MLSINDIFTVRKDLVDIIDVRNDKLSSINNHNLRVSEMSVKLAAAIGFPPEDINQVLIGSYLHDIGKIFLENDILQGDQPLSMIQKEEILRHTRLGHSYLNGVSGLDKAKEIILYHHERVDGKGYPDGLVGSEIPLHVRIVSICDSYDAMTSYRAYKPRKMTHEEAIKELTNYSGTQFDAELVEIFINQFNISYSNN